MDAVPSSTGTAFVRNHGGGLGLMGGPQCQERAMKTDPKDPAAVETRLWTDIEKRQTGMLGLTHSDEHFQPMTAFVERDTSQIWFFTRKDTDLAQQLGQGAKAMFVFQEDKLQACIGGTLSVANDRARMDKYWNAVVAAWYPEGKDDPHLTMLRLDCSDAEVWLSDGGLAKFAFEIAKANATHKTPDVGGRTHLNLH
jgi:general stress protein 26